MPKKLDKIYPWIVVALLWVVALLNYMDRQMLSTMREYMAVDIAQLNQAEAFGALMAIFLWIYAIVSPFAGTVADRVSRKWLIVGSLTVWSAVTLLMGYCTTFSQLKWLRGRMQDGGHLGAAFAVLGVVTAAALLVQLAVLKPVTDDMA